MDFDTNGRLPAGLHNYDIKDFVSQFVDGFPTSISRRLIFESMVEFFKEIVSTGIPYEFWVDGSYATTKINPNDADIVVFLQYPQYITLSPQFTNLRAKYKGYLDIYFQLAASKENQKILSPGDFNKVTNNRNYWRGQFGFDREDNPKGIICISCDSFKDYIDRG